MVEIKMIRAMSRPLYAISLAMSLALTAWPAVAHAGRPASPTGTFSSMYFHPEAGDLLGTEVRIVYTRKGFQGTIQFAEGEAGELILIKPIIDDDNHITFEFTDPSTGDRIAISGRITDAGLETKWWKGDDLLKRVPSYWDVGRHGPP